MILISGLPRSGSTLLANILAQNPNVVVDTTTPVPAMVRAMVDVVGTPSAHGYARKTHDIMQSCVKSAISAWAGEVAGDKTYIVKDRAMLPMSMLLPNDSSTILVVRDIVGIVESLEAALDRYPMHRVQYPARLADRIALYLSADFFLGASLNMVRAHLEDYVSTPIVRYEDLVSDPLSVLAFISTVIPELAFDYNIDDVRQIVPKENDNVHLPFGDHSISEGKIVAGGTNKHLPPDAAALIHKETEWFYATIYPTSLPNG
jgi:sulfotransferase